LAEPSATVARIAILRPSIRGLRGNAINVGAMRPCGRRRDRTRGRRDFAEIARIFPKKRAGDSKIAPRAAFGAFPCASSRTGM
jgi:hypothetical protein